MKNLQQETHKKRQPETRRKRNTRTHTTQINTKTKFHGPGPMLITDC